MATTRPLRVAVIGGGTAWIFDYDAGSPNVLAPA
jgi:hypothetical protein